MPILKLTICLNYEHPVSHAWMGALQKLVATGSVCRLIAKTLSA